MLHLDAQLFSALSPVKRVSLYTIALAPVVLLQDMPAL